MTEANDESTVVLKSKDDVTFDLPFGAAKLSELVRDSVEDESSEVEVLRVSSTCLAQVVEFLKHHAEDPMTPIPTPLGGNTFEDIVRPQWYQTFVGDLPREQVFDLLTAANYMGIKPLLDLTCLKVTFELTGKNAEEIRQILSLPNLTPEEEARARAEHQWVFEES